MKALELLQLLTVIVPAGFLTPTLAIQMALAICSVFFLFLFLKVTIVDK